MRLQTVHNKLRVPEASSLYCVWIQARPHADLPLVAVWIDREMRAFERECGACDGAELRTGGREEATIEAVSERAGSRRKEDQARR